MEDELRCFACKHFFEKPVLLPCGHALCLSCALGLQQSASNSEVDSVASSSSGDYQEADKVSIVSETDSGVVCGSRPGSYVGSINPNSTLFPTTALFLTCPICQKLVYFDENGANNLPMYKVMQTIIEKYKDVCGKTETTQNCQMCEESSVKLATIHCDQCSIFYCEGCREACHPPRGPLARHTLSPAGQRTTVTTCPEHNGTPLVAQCMPCRQPACTRCLQDRHANHDVQQLSTACKGQKVKTGNKYQIYQIYFSIKLIKIHFSDRTIAKSSITF